MSQIQETILLIFNIIIINFKEIIAYSFIAIIGLMLLYTFYNYITKHNTINEQGMLYNWFDASLANPPKKNIHQGFTWSTPSELNYFSNTNKKCKYPLILNRFKISEDYARMMKIPKWIKNYRNKKTEVTIDSADLSRGLLVVSGAGGGKSVLLNSWMHQKIGKRELFFSKKGEFETYYYRSSVDILLNLTHPDGAIHDVLSEKIEDMEIYVDTLLRGSVGDKKDFWSANAKIILSNIFQKVLTENLATTKEKWAFFVKEYDKQYDEAMNDKSQSLKDVFATLEDTRKKLYLAEYRIRNNAKTFVVDDFIKNENIKLFLSATDEQTVPFLAATFAVIVNRQLKMADIKDYDKDNLTTYWLDEYLSLVKIIDPAILNAISELGRSKGIQKIAAVQKLGDKKEDIEALLTNIEYIIISSETHDSTNKAIQALAGKVEYDHKRFSKNGKNISSQVELKSVDVIPDFLLKTSKSQDFAFITFIPKQKILYLSSTEVIEPSKRDFKIEEQIDFTDFYKEELTKADERQKRKQEVNKKEDAKVNINRLVKKSNI